MTRIIAIDPAIRKTGFALLEGNARQQKALDYGVIEAEKKIPQEQALAIINAKIEDLISSWKPEAMAIENIIFVQSKQTAIFMGSARACALIAAGKFKIPVFQYAPNKVKKSVLGRGQGKSDKEKVAFMIRALLGINHQIPIDASDAFAVGICHLQNHSK